MPTVVYLGDGDVGGAVVYGLPFTVGKPVALPSDWEWTAKVVNNGTFLVVADDTPLPAAVEPATVPAAKDRGRPRRDAR